jgi:hypothetical protein
MFQASEFATLATGGAVLLIVGRTICDGFLIAVSHAELLRDSNLGSGERFPWSRQ